MQCNYRTPNPEACSSEGCPVNFYRPPHYGEYRNRVLPKIITHPNRRPNGSRVLVLDLDNTLTDTRRWFADFILDATAQLADNLNTSASLVNSVFAQVAQATTLHEYAFVVEAICSRLGLQRSMSYEAIRAAAQQFWQQFAEAHESIDLYDGVRETLEHIRSQFPDLKVIILTDSPEWVALERLSITGLLPLVDGVVAIRTEEPRLRNEGYEECMTVTRQRIEAIKARINQRHLHLNLSMPSSFAKPSSAGVELIAKRLGISAGHLIICGDKDTKEGQAAAQFRLRERQSGMPKNEVHFVRANYGNHDLHDSRYSKLAEQIRSLTVTQALETSPVPVSSSIDKFDQLLPVLAEILSTAQREDSAA